MQDATTLWFYLKSASPIYTCTLPPQDERLAQLLEDVRMIRHGSHVFVHLRSEFEWDRVMRLLGENKAVKTSASTAA
ncbi:hypothetical protein EFA69_09705 [Rufibacter immobilis]|uniref:Uncharacterized protein n=1 Tax=Rufibacter immobilis TaxID=1348778 RepID=A0A3M9MW84_9BACT|nr:hypothetical protein [Rufibacter immobilis]RNI29802.1 hypothetical protein EFA69_09705 [Rufibacter immobilis]